MLEATLIIKPKSDYESDFTQIMDDYLLNFEASTFQDNEDIKDLANYVLDEYQNTLDDSMIPVITANIIIRHQTETGYAIGSFEAQLILRYAYILIYRSHSKIN